MKNKLRVLYMAFFALLLMTNFSVVQAQTNMDEYMAKWDNTKKYTLDILAKMPDSGMDYKTDPAAMSFKEQIHHVGNAIVGISQGFLKGTDPGFEINLESASRAQLAEYVGKCFDYGKKTIAALSSADAGEKIEVFGNTVSRRQVAALLMDHTSHHNGSAVAYIRVQGAEPPAYVGF
ncbi:DinB family protein [Algoriphagus sp.]|uniref:DinB family protein n=1 Tax=Algoriphagus sp. TaxID=1872435 RepID=UPI002601375F|nr:DinB family protein [Algoriphagus sp.]